MHDEGKGEKQDEIGEKTFMHFFSVTTRCVRGRCFTTVRCLACSALGMLIACTWMNLRK